MKAGIQLNFYLGQRVISEGVPGYIKTLNLEGDEIIATVVLDKPIVIPALTLGMRDISLYRSTVPLHQLVAEPIEGAA